MSSFASCLTEILTFASIIRVLCMVPIYSIVSFLSYLFYTHAVYFQVIYQCYEAFAIASFFALLCSYIAPDLHNQKDFFRGLHPRGWVLPLSWFKRCCGGDRGIWRTPRSGLTWFNVSWIKSGKKRMQEIDNVLDHLARRLPILLRTGFHDYGSPCNPGSWKVLRRIYQSCLRTRLGTL